MGSSFAFGERAVINLFRGAGGLLGSSGSGASGMDSLNARLQETFHNYFWASQVHSSYQGDIFNFREIGSQQAQAFTNQFDLVQALGVVGYSAGGLSAIRFATGQWPQPVDLVVQIETFDPLTGSSREDEILPGNVVKGINYYQLVNRFNPFGPGYDPLDLQGAKEVEGSENINAESFFGDRTLTHRNIEDRPIVQNQILQDIERYVLQDLEFDRFKQLSLQGGAQLQNNILSLRPGPNGEDGGAVFGELGNIDADFSFQTRFEFRLPGALNPGASPGLSFWIQPGGNYALQAAQSSLTITFEPFSLNPPSAASNAVGIFTPDTSVGPLAQAQVGLDLNSGLPLTAWVDYDGFTDQLSVFVDDSLVKPAVPLVSAAVELSSLTGPQALFGFQATVEGEDRSAELLTWQFNASGEFDPPLASAVVDGKRLPFDYNGDNKSDLGFFRPFSANGVGFGELGVWLLDGINQPVAQGSVDVYPFQGVEGDFFPALGYRNLEFNGDGKTDLLFTRSLNKGEGFELGVWLLDGTRPMQQAVIGTVPTAWDNPLKYDSFAPRLPSTGSGKGPFGDFNGDEKTDILLLKTDPTGNRSLGIWLVDGITPTAQVNVANIGSDWLPINLNDFNADGRDDVLFERLVGDGTVEYGIWLMDGVTPTLQRSIGSVPAGEGWRVLDTNDVNRDGKADILFSRQVPTAPGLTEYGLWLMDGVTPILQTVIGEPQVDRLLVDHNDFNGDGKADLLFSRPSGVDSVEYSVWLMDGPLIIADSVIDIAPASWAYAGSADVNGDGKADLEFVNEQTRQVGAWLMNGSTFSGQGVIGIYDAIDSPAGWLPPLAIPETTAGG
jgi:hypothetical protein